MNNKLNTNVYKNPYEHDIIDLSSIGTINTSVEKVYIYQPSHFFEVGEILYYNIKDKKFDKALAVNRIDSEACGCVSEIVDRDNFVLITKGFVETSLYSFSLDAGLYLSEIIPGRLIDTEPLYVMKRIATQSKNGIIVDIQRGLNLQPIDTSSIDTIEYYTQQELDDIIMNLW